MVVPDPITGMEYDVEPPTPLKLEISVRLPWQRYRVNDDWGRNFYALTLERAMAKARRAPALPIPN